MFPSHIPSVCNTDQSDLIESVLFHCYIILFIIHIPIKDWKKPINIKSILTDMLLTKKKKLPNFYNDIIDLLSDPIKREIQPDDQLPYTLLSLQQSLIKLKKYSENKIPNIKKYQNLEEALNVLMNNNQCQPYYVYHIPFLLSSFDDLPSYFYPYYITFSRPLGITDDIKKKLSVIQKSYIIKGCLKSYIYLYSLLLIDNPPSQSDLDTIGKFDVKKLSSQYNYIYIELINYINIKDQIKMIYQLLQLYNIYI